MTSTKKKRRLCDLSGKRHRVFSSVTSVASVVPLCRLCGKKALCTFLNKKKSEFSLRNVHSAFFPQRRHRGTTEATEVTEEKTRCLFSERSQRLNFFFADELRALISSYTSITV